MSTFLLGHRRDGAARDFDRLIYQLRTSQQHTDNSEAIARFTLTRAGILTRHDQGGRLTSG